MLTCKEPSYLDFWSRGVFYVHFSNVVALAKEKADQILISAAYFHTFLHKYYSYLNQIVLSSNFLML